jgi:hypothetical protein
MSYVAGKSRPSKGLTRRSRRIKEFSRVLITCEGSKTEPNYFREACKDLGLTSAMVEVAGKECGSSPMSVCDYALARLKEDGSFDEVFCVFDRDTHQTFDAAVKKIAGHSSKKLRSIVSYPCFEYWVLLHFRYTRGAVRATGGKSPGNQMLDLVVAEWPDYAKGLTDMYKRLTEKGLTEVAIANSVKARGDAVATQNPDPSTEVDILLLRLRELAKESGAIAN